MRSVTGNVTARAKTGRTKFDSVVCIQEINYYSVCVLHINYIVKTCSKIICFMPDIYRTHFECGNGSISCQNGACAHDLYRCLYGKDKYGLPLGCRDVTHLQQCGMYNMQTVYHLSRK